MAKRIGTGKEKVVVIAGFLYKCKPSGRSSKQLCCDLMPKEGKDHDGRAVLVESIPGVLYHWTPRRNLARVRTRGLRPRSSRWAEGRRRTYANRIYFTISPAANARMKRKLEEEDVKLGKRSRPDSYVELRIDPAKVSGMRLYVDPEHPRTSVFTTKPVPASAIKIVGLPSGR